MSYSQLELNGKVAVIIGGTSGIGLAIARGMAEAGADVVPSSRRLEQTESAAKEIEDRGRRSLRIPSDVADRGSLQNLLNECVKAFGKVDILVNSAGRTKRAPTLDFSEEDWDSILDTNLTGTLRTAQIFGRHMLEREYGSIINIASLSTFVALYEVAAYCASKAAVASLTKSLAIEWGQRGVRVNAIAPGWIESEMMRSAFNGDPTRAAKVLGRTPMNRFGDPEDIGWAATYLCSPAAKFVTGVVLPVDGGASIGF